MTARVVLLGLCAAALVAAGCGSDTAGAGSYSGPGSTTARAGRTGSPTPSGTPSPTSTRDHRHEKPQPGPPPTVPPPPSVPARTTVTCPSSTTEVSSADELESALSSAGAGDVIHLADGTYKGEFVAKAAGTAGRPIFLCGGSGAVLDGDNIRGGYVMHLDGASYWRLVGFTVRGGQKGVVADHSQHSVIQGLTVKHIGDEGIHLREFSSNDVVQGNTISDTGLRRDKFGEGVYVGTAESNWCRYTDCKPDHSDHDVVRGNKISGTTAECVDIKEGTTGGVLIGNTFDGSKLTGADSWVDVKGNSWLVQGNTGQHSPEDGFQTHSVVEGWGTGNVFRANTAAVDGPGYGIHLAPVVGNKISCDNKVTAAGAGTANIDCS